MHHSIYKATISRMQPVSIHTLDELTAEARRFVATLRPREQGATLVTLSGNLGAGKTAYSKAVAATLGITETVTSPTFVLEKIYQVPPPHAFRRLVHIDAYRLERGAELAPLGFDELMRDAENLVLLEWPEKVSEVLPLPSVAISITVTDADARTITYG